MSPRVPLHPRPGGCSRGPPDHLKTTSPREFDHSCCEDPSRRQEPSPDHGKPAGYLSVQVRTVSRLLREAQALHLTDGIQAHPEGCDRVLILLRTDVLIVDIYEQRIVTVVE